MIASLASYTNVLALAIIFAGNTLIELVGGIHRVPTIIKDSFNWIQENKIYFFFVAFFGSTMIQTQLMSSGAFEIYINGNLEFSKLGNNQMPDWAAVQLIMRKYGVNLK
jgi:hypothetical protein